MLVMVQWGHLFDWICFEEAKDDHMNHLEVSQLIFNPICVT